MNDVTLKSNGVKPMTGYFAGSERRTKVALE